MGAPVGNQNAKRKPWKDALRRALARKSGSVEAGLNALADQVVDCANNGDWQAIQEIAIRVEGKPAQLQIIQGDDDGGPVSHNVTVSFRD